MTHLLTWRISDVDHQRNNFSRTMQFHLRHQIFLRFRVLTKNYFAALLVFDWNLILFAKKVKKVLFQNWKFISWDLTHIICLGPVMVKTDKIVKFKIVIPLLFDHRAQFYRAIFNNFWTTNFFWEVILTEQARVRYPPPISFFLASSAHSTSSCAWGLIV